MRTADPPRYPSPERREEEQKLVQHPYQGVGPLLQRDYIVVVAGSRCSPEEIIRQVRADFARFSPEELAAFSPPHGSPGLLEVGDTMAIRLAGYGCCAVVCTHADERSFTLRTLEGHLETGRITFGAYHDAAGRIVLRIRNRSRIKGPMRTAGYHLMGIHVQTRIWVTFVQRMAGMSGGRLLGDVVTSTEPVPDEPADLGHTEAPTFDAWQADGLLRQGLRALSALP